MDYTYNVPAGDMGVRASDGVSGEAAWHLLEFL